MHSFMQKAPSHAAGFILAKVGDCSKHERGTVDGDVAPVKVNTCKVGRRIMNCPSLSSPHLALLQPSARRDDAQRVVVN